MAPISLSISSKIQGLSLRIGGGSAPATTPVIAGVPTITGTPANGQVLTANPAPVTGAPVITRTWQWHRNGVDIPGATSATYTVVTADVSAFLSVTQIETNGFGFDFAVSTTVLVPYSPFTNLLGYQFSIDPSVIGTLFTDTAGTVPVTAPGDLVACVRDPFTNAIVATQAASANRPIYQVDAGGKAYLQMSDGVTNRWLVTPSLTFSTSGFNRMLTIFAVQQDQRPGTNSHLQEWASGNGRMRWLVPQAGNTHSVDSRGTAQALASVAFPVVTLPVKMLLGAYATIPNDNVVFRRDKAQVGQNTADQGTGSYANGLVYIGANTTGTAPFIGRLYSYIMAANGTTDYVDADILPAENYADARLNP